MTPASRLLLTSHARIKPVHGKAKCARYDVNKNHAEPIRVSFEEKFSGFREFDLAPFTDAVSDHRIP
jgi:hypothetical protein